MSVDTPELAQLYRRYQRYDRLAKQYNMVLDERTGDSLVHLVIDTVHHTMTPVLRLVMHVVAIPKTLPRDRPTAWYVEKYIEYRTKADNAHDLYEVLRDWNQKQAYEAMSREEKLARLHEIGTGLAKIEEEIATWRAKVPAWERKQAEREPPEPDRAIVQAYIDHMGDPKPMIETLEDFKCEREAERDWLMERL
jgi:hypothetical protein